MAPRRSVALADARARASAARRAGGSCVSGTGSPPPDVARRARAGGLPSGSSSAGSPDGPGRRGCGRPRRWAAQGRTRRRGRRARSCATSSPTTMPSRWGCPAPSSCTWSSRRPTCARIAAMPEPSPNRSLMGGTTPIPIATPRCRILPENAADSREVSRIGPAIQALATSRPDGVGLDRKENPNYPPRKTILEHGGGSRDLPESSGRPRAMAGGGPDGAAPATEAGNIGACANIY